MPTPRRPFLGDLFAPEPEQWGLRGDPWVWAAMRGRLDHREIPDTDEQVEQVLTDTFRELVNVELTQGSLGKDEEQVYREQFSRGGMSSGLVHVVSWRDRLIPLLLSRAADARDARSQD